MQYHAHYSTRGASIRTRERFTHAAVHVPGLPLAQPRTPSAGSHPICRTLVWDRSARYSTGTHLTLRAVALLEPGASRRFCVAGPIWRHCVSRIAVKEGKGWQRTEIETW